MERGPQGRYLTTPYGEEEVRAFVPDPLPPTRPIAWSTNLQHKFDQAMAALGRLDSVATLLPNTELFLYMYVRKEAVVSSMIEGTQSSLADLLLYEMDETPGVPLDDVQEVSRYVAALNHGLTRLAGGFPLSLRLIREIHEMLLREGRGRDKQPGEFRRTQNWIGGTRPGNALYVPPPPEDVLPCMGALELFWHDQPEPTPVLVKAALAHVQFETIHPFLDGNGRLGRLLITLLLCDQGVLTQPLLYLSLYFKIHRQHYYHLLNHVRVSGDWEAWLDFFADAVIATARQAVSTATNIMTLTTSDQHRIATLGRAAQSAALVHDGLVTQPIATAQHLSEQSGLSQATVNKALANLTDLGIVAELTSKKRNRVFAYQALVNLLNEGTEGPACG